MICDTAVNSHLWKSLTLNLVGILISCNASKYKFFSRGSLDTHLPIFLMKTPFMIMELTNHAVDYSRLYPSFLGVGIGVGCLQGK